MSFSSAPAVARSPRVGSRHRTRRLGRLTLAATLLVAIPAGARAENTAASGPALFQSRGCVQCHAQHASDSGSPVIGPAVDQIRTRYRGIDDASATLQAIIVDGTDPSMRHWKGKVRGLVMPANAAVLSPAEAQTIADWILRQP